ncbi:hypothetical protein TNCV_815081 [Trichonephila clavipes]|nr:hypothetical protein TNCV_815081 [Trichonephila clavipes]
MDLQASLTEELRQQAIERLKAGESQIEVARWPNGSPGNVKAHTYREDILDACVRPYDRVIGDVFVLQDDNARPHRAHIVDAYLEQEIN